MDNCNTFDPLLENYFNKFPDKKLHYDIVCIDLTGHGRSSHASKGIIQTPHLHYFYDICRVINYLKWEKFNLVGHSLGGNLSLTYAGIYNENIENVLTLSLLERTYGVTIMMSLIT